VTDVSWCISLFLVVPCAGFCFSLTGLILSSTHDGHVVVHTPPTKSVSKDRFDLTTESTPRGLRERLLPPFTAPLPPILIDGLVFFLCLGFSGPPSSCPTSSQSMRVAEERTELEDFPPARAPKPHTPTLSFMTPSPASPVVASSPPLPWDSTRPPSFFFFFCSPAPPFCARPRQHLPTFFSYL